MKKVFLFLLFVVLLNAQEVTKTIWEEAFTFLILKPIISFFIGILVGAYFRKFLKFMKKNLFIFGDKISSKNRFKGIWKAVFIYNEQPFTENIKLYVVFEKFVLGIIQDGESKFNNSVRLYGSIIEDNRITGEWYHPDEDNKHSGTFDLSLEQNGRSIVGSWTGQNIKTNPQKGLWKWQK